MIHLKLGGQGDSRLISTISCQQYFIWWDCQFRRIPEDVDGRVLTEIINRDFIEKNEIRFEPTKERVASEKKF